MRRILEIISLAALAVLVAITAMAMFGPQALPDRIPTHFDAEGHANGWGSPHMLLGLPIGAVVLYALMTMAARRPAAFNFPTRVTAANRGRLEELALQMISWLKAEVLCLFAWIQHFTIEAGRSGRGSLPAIFMPVTLGAVFGTIFVYFALFRRTAS